MSDTWCKHRTPFSGEYKTCNAGVNFHPFRKDAYKQRPSLMPCLGECAEARARCEKYEGYTPEELAEQEKFFRERLARIDVIREAIIAKLGKAAGSGTIDCPACKTGMVAFSRASNGHIHARCSTPKCASWME